MYCDDVVWIMAYRSRPTSTRLNSQGWHENVCSPDSSLKGTFWNLCLFCLVSHPKRSLTGFAKIQCDFHQLSDEMKQPLRNALLDLLILHANGPRAIMIQICISLAALALQLQSWSTAIPDVVNACTRPKEYMDALLQFLAVLPEEACDGRRMILTVPRFETNHVIVIGSWTQWSHWRAFEE